MAEITDKDFVWAIFRNRQFIKQILDSVPPPPNGLTIDEKVVMPLIEEYWRRTESEVSESHGWHADRVGDGLEMTIATRE